MLINASGNIALVHYIGDEKEAVDFLHRSAKKLKQIFRAFLLIRSCIYKRR